MDIGIPVEVEGTYGEFYPGLVCGVHSHDEYKVKLLDAANSCIGEVCLPPNAMRLPPEINSFPFDPVHGQEVDVLIPFSQSDDSSEGDQSVLSPLNRLSAWWPGKVKKVGGSFVIVELGLIFETESQRDHPSSNLEVKNGRINIPRPSTIEKTDIVERHQLRPRSHQANFTASSFHRHSIDIPDELEKYCEDPSNFQHFARRCGLPVLVCMAPDTLMASIPAKESENGDTFEHKARLLVISTDIATIKRAAVIDNTFIDMLRQKVTILQQTAELSRKLEASRVSQASPAFVEDLYVPEELIHYAIGFQAANLRRAHNIPGIISIKLNRPACIFRISGKTEAAVQQAKALLDYSTETIPVPRCYVGPIVGSGQRHIQHIVDCLELNGLKICDMPEADMADFVAFQLTGTSQAIKDARMFLEFHVASLQDLDRLRGISSPPSIPSTAEMMPQSPTELPEEFCEAAPTPPSRRQGGRSSLRTRQKSTSAMNGMNSTKGDEQSEGEKTHLINGIQRARQDESAGDHMKPHPKSRPRRPQNLQTNNSAVMHQGPRMAKGSGRRPPELAKINSHADCNGIEANLMNGIQSQAAANGEVPHCRAH